MRIKEVTLLAIGGQKFGNKSPGDLAEETQAGNTDHSLFFWVTFVG